MIFTQLNGISGPSSYSDTHLTSRAWRIFLLFSRARYSFSSSLRMPHLAGGRWQQYSPDQPFAACEPVCPLLFLKPHGEDPSAVCERHDSEKPSRPCPYNGQTEQVDFTLLIWALDNPS